MTDQDFITPEIRFKHLGRLEISEAARMFNLTHRALHYYEGKGLIVAQRDRMNHRVYDGATMQRLWWISRLRSAGLPLSEVEEVLATDDDTAAGLQHALAKLRAHKRALADRLRQLETSIQLFAAEATAARKGLSAKR